MRQPVVTVGSVCVEGEETDQHTAIRAWSWGDLLLEQYRRAPGPVEGPAKHSHEECQIGFSLDSTAGYSYRGAFHGVPVGALSVIHSGEAHRSRAFVEFRAPATYRMMYVSPALLRDAATEMTGHESGEPFFPVPIVLDGDLARRFLESCLTLEGPASKLEKDSLILSMLTAFVRRHAEGRFSPRTTGKERRAVKLAREYLEDNLRENVSLEDLSRLANLSPYHLSRVFGEEVGMPPHAYQIQARMKRAKGLLLRGWSLARAAQETGFFDQSHFARHFKRRVGVSPGAYAINSKNIHYDGPGSP